MYFDHLTFEDFRHATGKHDAFARHHGPTNGFDVDTVQNSNGDMCCIEFHMHDGENLYCVVPYGLILPVKERELC